MKDEPTCEFCYSPLSKDEITESLGTVNYLLCDNCLESELEYNGEEYDG